MSEYMGGKEHYKGVPGVHSSDVLPARMCKYTTQQPMAIVGALYTEYTLGLLAKWLSELF